MCRLLIYCLTKTNSAVNNKIINQVPCANRIQLRRYNEQYIVLTIRNKYFHDDRTILLTRTLKCVRFISENPYHRFRALCTILINLILNNPITLY